MVDERTFINETGFSPGVSATYTVDGTELLEVYLAGVERGRREALTEASREMACSRAATALAALARAGETPGGAA